MEKQLEIKIIKCLFATGFAFCLIGTGLFIATPENQISFTKLGNRSTEISSLNYFKDLNLKAKAVIVYDPESDSIVYSSNERSQLPLASLTKVMTAMVANDIVGGDTVVTVRNNNVNAEGTPSPAMGEEWQLSKLINFTLVSSSNVGAHALALAAEDVNSKNFIQEMNAQAKNLGLSETYFLNETGLDIASDQAGAYGTALDIAKLFSHVLKTSPEIIESTRATVLRERSQTNTYTVSNTNDLVRSLPGIIASKTGYTDLAQGNLALAYDAGLRQPYIIVVLGSTEQGRFDDVAQLIKATGEYVAAKDANLQLAGN